MSQVTTLLHQRCSLCFAETTQIKGFLWHKWGHRSPLPSGAAECQGPGSGLEKCLLSPSQKVTSHISDPFGPLIMHNLKKWGNYFTLHLERVVEYIDIYLLSYFWADKMLRCSLVLHLPMSHLRF